MPKTVPPKPFVLHREGKEPRAYSTREQAHAAFDAVIHFGNVGADLVVLFDIREPRRPGRAVSTVGAP